MNGFEASLLALKSGMKQVHKKDAEKMKMVWDYKEKTVNVFIKFKNDKAAYDCGKNPFAEDENSVKMGDALLAGIKKRLKNCKEIVYMKLLCNFETVKVEEHAVYYIDNDNKKQTFKND